MLNIFITNLILSFEDSFLYTRQGWIILVFVWKNGSLNIFIFLSFSLCYLAPWAFCRRSAPVHVWWVVQTSSCCLSSYCHLLFRQIKHRRICTQYVQRDVSLNNIHTYISPHICSMYFHRRGQNIGSVSRSKALWQSCRFLKWNPSTQLFPLQGYKPISVKACDSPWLFKLHEFTVSCWCLVWFCVNCT